MSAPNCSALGQRSMIAVNVVIDRSDTPGAMLCQYLCSRKVAKIPDAMRGDIFDRLQLAMAAAKPPIIDAPALAKRCKLASSTARAYVNGTRTPSLEACEKIGRAIGVRAQWIFYGEGEMEAPEETARPNLDGVLRAAVEEAFLQAKFSLDAAAEIALAVELHVGTLRVPRGQTPEEAIRRIMRFEIPDILARKR